MQKEITKINFPVYGWVGLLFIGVFWYLNWSLNGLRTQWGFFPLWLGYCLTVDAVVYKRKGTSLIKRSLWSFIVLFVISAPSWWLFEFFNHFTKNWHYDGRQYFTNLQYFLLASLSFSTVMPAVFGTAELAATFKWIRKIGDGKVIKRNKTTLFKLFTTGLIMLILIIVLPEYFYYLIWIALYLIMDPINSVFKNRTLLQYTERGNWRPLFALAVGTLICGFFWEMWNYYSYPKWIYHLPFVNFLHMFEMPLPGYIGYIPFSFELFALYHFVTGVFSKNKSVNYIQVS